MLYYFVSFDSRFQFVAKKSEKESPYIQFGIFSKLSISEQHCVPAILCSLMEAIRISDPAVLCFLMEAHLSFWSV